MKRIYSLIFLGVSLGFTPPVFSQYTEVRSNSGSYTDESKSLNDLIGKWRSEAIRYDDATLIIFMQFDESQNFSIEFETEYDIPEINSISSYVTAVGRYTSTGSTFRPDLEERVKTDISDIVVKKNALKDKEPNFLDKVNSRLNSEMHSKLDYLFDTIDLKDLKYYHPEEDRMVVEINYPLKKEVRFQRLF